MLVDTHAHIHFDNYKDDLDIIFENARSNGVKKIITVGTDDLSSKSALEFCYSQHPKSLEIYGSAGLHPHDTDNSDEKLSTIKDIVVEGGYGDKLVAVGECGLDYFKNHSSKRSQFKALEFQIELAIEQNLPLIFHVRDAWEDFFEVLKNYRGIRGVVHSFTGSPREVEKAVEQGLYFGLNGIMTFTREPFQLEACKAIPYDRLLLETDCPFLSPAPKRGKQNEPANLIYIAKFLAKLLGISKTDLEEMTTSNAITLFGLK